MKYSKFKNLKDESVRQFNELSQASGQSSLRSQVLMGFVIGFFSLLFTQNTTHDFSFMFDTFYIIVIGFAGLFGFLAYWVRDYPIGIDVEELFYAVKENPQIEEDVFIFKEINEANKRNLEKLYVKNSYLKAGYLSYGVGLLLFIAIRFINSLGYI